jgi:hypothetical protein
MGWKAKIVRMGMEKMSALTEDDGIQRRGFKDLSNGRKSGCRHTLEQQLGL